jgi:VanZ family protein
MPTFSQLSPIFLRGLSFLVWMGVIFFFSALPGNGYSNTSFLYHMERKGAHVIEYMVLMLLSVRFATALFPREIFKRILLLAALFSVTYGATDELHQFFVPYRGALVSDVLVDSLGVFLTGALLWLVMKYAETKKTDPISK